MSKLDEIEREAADCESDVDSTNWMKDHAALLVRAVRHLGEVRNELEELMDESRGVDGIHLNGDIATWNELITGVEGEDGVYGVSWLDAFSAPQDDVLELIAPQEGREG